MGTLSSFFSITFVIPALNEEAYIGDCLASIRREAPAVPVIVVDNGSEDATAEIARSWGATVLSQPERGINKARQLGLERAQTKWVAFIDADNVLPEEWLTIALHGLQEKNVVALSGPPVFHDTTKTARIATFAFYCAGRALHTVLPMMQGGNFIVDRDALIRAGGFDTNVDFYGEDTITAKRLSVMGKVKFDLALFCYSSARRLKAEGTLRTGTRYAANYFWVWLAGKPLTKTHRDHREAA